MHETPYPAQGSQNSAAIGKQIGIILPDLLEVVGDQPQLEIRKAGERTCLRPEIDEPQTNTSWLGLVSGSVEDESAAHDALDRIDQHFQANGWEKNNKNDDRADDRRTLYLTKGDLWTNAKLRGPSSKRSLEVFVTTSCIDQPVEHRMQRLELDPDYGKNSRYHDDWK